MTQAEKNELTRDALIEFAMRRIESTIRHFLRIGKIRECDADDLRQGAIVAVLEKLDEFDAKRKVCKKTYVGAIISNVFKFHFLEARWGKNQTHEDIDALSEEEMPRTNEGGPGNLSETELADLRFDLYAFRETLTKTQQSVFDLMAFYSQSEMAARLGMAQSRINGICQEIREAAEISSLKNYF